MTLFQFKKSILMSIQLHTVEFPHPESEDFVTLYIQPETDFKPGSEKAFQTVEFIDCPEIGGKVWDETAFIAEFGQENFDWVLSMCRVCTDAEAKEYRGLCAKPGRAADNEEPMGEGDPHAAEKFAAIHDANF